MKSSCFSIIKQPQLQSKQKQTTTNKSSMKKLQWINDSPPKTICDTNKITNWLERRPYVKERGLLRLRSRSNNISTRRHSLVPNVDDDKTTTITGISGKCRCNNTTGKYVKKKKNEFNYNNNNNKNSINLGKNIPNSVVAKYVKKSMNHVASFIVESAIRFGEEHGVVKPDKTLPNVYEITPPKRHASERNNNNNKRLKIKKPDKMLGYEDAKKVMWRSDNNNLNRNSAILMDDMYKPRSKAGGTNKTSSWSSQTDSLEDILPILEELKKDEHVVTSDLNLTKLSKNNPALLLLSSSSSSSNTKLRKKEKNLIRYRRILEKIKGTESDNKLLQPQQQQQQPQRRQQRQRRQRQQQQSPDHHVKKRFKKDSIEIDRQRLKGSTISRKQDVNIII
ncbi:hypothetical protein Phum_PHUM361060 [Pediculus humanus corporis]|uniref:Uncharacterized protein n=1 Tax=Pediculus humanus subsp. corporis TaxID=121224 RepID=E0VPK0_PEDHC|nr:uncharacterized protein Phum_PHUM361060 [Pediculus humanus corporis]EEB15306.1 hypothetical protein Phum_PHUM361060 [Pediculus humanus corporis]